MSTEAPLRYWRTTGYVLRQSASGMVTLSISGWDLSHGPITLARADLPDALQSISAGDRLIFWVAEDRGGHLHLKDFEPATAPVVGV